MVVPPAPVETYSAPAANDIVSFSIICQPAHGAMSAADYHARLPYAPLSELWPDPTVLARVADRLRTLGFEVNDQTASPIVIAAGTVAQFEATFHASLTKLTRRTYDEHGEEITAIVIAKNSAVPLPDAIPGALIVTVAPPPLLANTPQTTPNAGTFCLDLHNGVAVLTRSKSANRLKVPRTERLATGEGVKVAVVDSGFYNHTFFAGHPYKITRLSSWRAGPAGDDPRHHGTFVLANLLVCAPDVDAYGVKFVDPNSGFATALGIRKIRIISFSWCWDVGAIGWDPQLDSLYLQIRDAVDKGVTVVVAAGNWSIRTFPAMLQEVIAVGGVAIDATPATTAWFGTTAFPVSATHQVPDLCGIASNMNLPFQPPSGQADIMMCREGETSCATAQVAGVAALLVQKRPTLTPQAIKGYLTQGASDVVLGSTFSNQNAGPGPDPATGHGLVNAEQSWLLVP